jgi:hypothetical protein
VGTAAPQGHADAGRARTTRRVPITTRRRPSTTKRRRIRRSSRSRLTSGGSERCSVAASVIVTRSAGALHNCRSVSPRRRAIGHYASVATYGERAGESLQRAPYVWLTATVLGFLLLNSGLVRIAPDPGRGSTPLAAIGTALGVAGALIWLLFQRASVRRTLPTSSFMLARWALASTPFVFAYSAVAAGGEQWAFFWGMLLSLALLVISARRTKRESRAAHRPTP